MKSFNIKVGTKLLYETSTGQEVHLLVLYIRGDQFKAEVLFSNHGGWSVGDTWAGTIDFPYKLLNTKQDYEIF